MISLNVTDLVSVCFFLHLDSLAYSLKGERGQPGPKGMFAENVK